MTGYSIMGLVDRPGASSPARSCSSGRDLRALAPAEMRQLRGNRIAMIFQDPMMTLNPVLRIDTQMIEAISRTSECRRRAARGARRDALAQGRHPVARRAARELSAPVLGRHAPARGDRDRAAQQARPHHRRRADDRARRDDPGPDPVRDAEALRETGTALIWITHDLSVVAGARRPGCVMYAGRIVEEGDDAGGARRAAASVHAGAARLGAEPRRARGAPLRADSGHDAVARRTCRRAARSRRAAAAPTTTCRAERPELVELATRPARALPAIRSRRREAVA